MVARSLQVAVEHFAGRAGPDDQRSPRVPRRNRSNSIR
jgi:hypothetical protein